MTLSEAARQVIELARETRDYYAAELPKWYPDYPMIPLGQPGPPQPSAEVRLEELFRSFSDDLVYRLLAVMYLGRGDFEPREIRQTYDYLKTTFEKPEYAVSAMLGKAPLADYLSDGLSELRKHGIDPDSPFTTRPKVARRPRASR
jgi:hypothetical protein